MKKKIIFIWKKKYPICMFHFDKYNKLEKVKYNDYIFIDFVNCYDKEYSIFSIEDEDIKNLGLARFEQFINLFNNDEYYKNILNKLDVTFITVDERELNEGEGACLMNKNFECDITYYEIPVMNIKFKEGKYELRLENIDFIKKHLSSEVDNPKDSTGNKFMKLWKQLRTINLLNKEDISITLVEKIYDKYKLDGMELVISYLECEENKNNNPIDKLNKITETKHPNFSDVIGMDKIKDRLNDVIDQFKNEEKYKEWNIDPIRGMLLYGPSGTGKSFIAEALANEVDATFVKCSASDIFHKYIGESEASIRKLFEDARKRKGKTIIFIDEIDAVASRRSDDDRNAKNSTLNELLVQMASSDNKDIFTIFATNMKNMLDPAFLRSGRVDFKIEVELPDFNMRKGILESYSKNRPLSDDVDLESIAKDMSGKNCADMKLVANEAARNALKAGKDKIYQQDFRDAYEEMIVGLPDKNRNFEKRERHITAVHETGHLLANILLKNNQTIKRISILPRGSILGFVHSTDNGKDKYMSTKEELMDNIKELLAGRAAEEILCDQVTTGASNDLEVANNIARSIVLKYGFTREYGFVIDNQYDFISKEKATKIMREILDGCYKEVKGLLRDNIDMLIKISEELEDKEELNEEEIKMIIKEMDEKIIAYNM